MPQSPEDTDDCALSSSPTSGLNPSPLATEIRRQNPPAAAAENEDHPPPLFETRALSPSLTRPQNFHNFENSETSAPSLTRPENFQNFETSETTLPTGGDDEDPQIGDPAALMDWSDPVFFQQQWETLH